MANKSRPEHTLPPELYYDDDQAAKYSRNTHIIEVQTRISERAIELLAIPEGESSILLDIGCGSGLSGDCLTEAGHVWVGADISKSMLSIARDREVDGDLMLADVGQGLPFRGAAFDGAISISAIQWLCNAETSRQNPYRRIRAFFTSLYACLTRDARAVLQFYPESVSQTDLLQTEAARAGFSGGMIVDFPNSTKARKCFLVLDVNPVRKMPEAIVESAPGVIPVGVSLASSNSARQARKNKRHPKNTTEWIKQKKERARAQMKETCHDSRYTGRKRKNKF